MKQSGFALALVCLFLLGFPGGAAAFQQNPTPAAPAQAAVSLSILAPTPGQALQGIVRIQVQAGGEAFQSAEIAFAYAGDATATWFLIDERLQPIDANTPIEWDTSRISDGDYTLRLVVIASDGSRQSMDVPGLRVRNYTAIETSTPAPAAPTHAAASTPAQTAAANVAPPPAATQALTPTPAPTAAPTLTPTPAVAVASRNPAAIQPEQVQLSILRGMLAALGAFALGGVYWSLRRMARR